MLNLFLNLTRLLKYVPFLGALGVLPSLAKVASDITGSASPLLRGVFEGLVWYVKSFWEGLTNVLSNGRNVLFVVSVIVIAGLYVKHQEEIQCQQEIVEVRKKLTPSKAKTYPQREDSFFSIFDDWFK